MADSTHPESERSIIERLNILRDIEIDQRNDLGDQPKRKGLKIALCLICSLLLWVFSSMSEIYSKIIEVDTRIENLDVEEAFLTLPPDKIQLHVKGEGLSLIQLYYNPPKVVIDASDTEINLIDVVARNLPAPIQIERVTPPIFILQKEERMDKKIPIILNAEINTPLTYDLVQEPSIFPDSVIVSGASSLIEQINEWPTELFAAEEVKDTLSFEVNLVDSLNGLVDLSIMKTQLLLVAEEFTEGGRDIEVLINDVPSIQDYVTLDPPVVEVTYRVPLSQYYQANDARDFFLFVSIDDIRDDTTGYVTPHLELPEGILFRDVNIEPDKLRYYDVLLDE